jgi:hypothetical protein
MIADKKILTEVKSFLQNQEGWDLDDFITDLLGETKLLRSKNKKMENLSLSADECTINWGEEEVCMFDDFIETYTRLFINKMCNVLDSLSKEGAKDE